MIFTKNCFHLRSSSPPSTKKSLQLVDRGARWLPWIVRLFYLYVAYAFWDGRLKLAHYFQPDSELDLLWPVFWAEWVRPDQAALGVGILLLNATVLVLLIPQFRWIRILFAFAFLEYLALIYSFGKIGHGLHLALWTSILLIFLPPNWHRPRHSFRPQRLQSVLILGAIQVAIGLSYFLAGFWKCIGALWQISQGDLHAFHPRALELHVADRVLQTQESPLLANWVMENAYWLWPLMPLTILLQLGGLGAAFRPRLHFAFGTMLIAMHLFISASMGIHFRHNIALLILFYLASPLQYQTTLWHFWKDCIPLNRGPKRA